jgi:UDP:flavonoid glycosyltransferase YjiC (YdhE family)
MDWPRRADHLVQFTVPEFEYPRSDLPDSVHFVGPVSQSVNAAASAADGTALPAWWGELDAGRPVVHVTQGTVANQDFNDLIRPTIDALAHEDVLVIVGTGGRPPADLTGMLPANVRVTANVPYDDLLPKVDVIVTNGGYGGVQFALRHGVPLVVAGETEDKTEVSARVQWSGTGINLRSNRPSPSAIGKAVRTVLSTPGYKHASERMAAAITASRGVDGLADLVETITDPALR